MIRIISSLLLSCLVAYGFAQNTTINFGANTTCMYELSGTTPQTILVTFSKANAHVAPTATYTHNGQLINITPNTQSYENSLNLMLNTDQNITPNDNLFWLSKARFYEVSMGKSMFYINGQQEIFGMAVIGKEDIQIKVNGNMVNTEAYHLSRVGNGPALELWILNNDKNPVVVKATGVVNLQLTEINY